MRVDALMARALSVLCLWLLPAVALAQSTPVVSAPPATSAPLAQWYASTTVLRADDTPVAVLHQSLLDVRAIEEFRATVTAETADVRLSGNVSDAGGGLYATTRADVTFTSDEGFRVDLLANRWAPIRGFDATSVTIGFADTIPAGSGTLPLSLARAGTSADQIVAHWWDEPRRGGAAIDSECQLDLAASPGGPGRFRPVAGAWIDGREQGAERVAYESEGFRAFGYRTPGACRRDGVWPTPGGIDAREPSPPTVARAVRLPAGTDLYAAPSSTAPFGSLRAGVVAFEHEGRWLLFLERGATQFLVRAHVRVAGAPTEATLPAAAAPLFRVLR